MKMYEVRLTNETKNILEYYPMCTWVERKMANSKYEAVREVLKTHRESRKYADISIPIVYEVREL